MLRPDMLRVMIGWDTDILPELTPLTPDVTIIGVCADVWLTITEKSTASERNVFILFVSYFEMV